MPFCRKGSFIFLSGIVCLDFIGCVFPVRGSNTVHEPIPPSHTQVEEKVIEQAIEDLGLPEGYGEEVSCVITGDDKASSMVRIIAPEILLEYGYRIVEKKSSAPELIFTVDTLHVTLTSDHTERKGKRVNRYVEARIGAVLFRAEGTKLVYKGYGTLHDSFASHMKGSLEKDDPYVIDLMSHVRLTEKIKPIVIGVGMTVLVWTLYSYRG